ncbi:MAG TPA: aromatic-ring-hydroxylating dioxygenase subunit beta [Candidatus Binataceae bacterium]|jgi:3-phenylpropionate/cinnamic acid dioxygenase small subunit|nr:aromatic-ring-hydroxylating dioxygenase subunit beta [Candidatus Binataceae bacterium]
MALDYRRVENFLYREARLMDDNAYDEWLALWAPDALYYWVPCNSDDSDPERQVSAIYDDRRRLEDRITRLRDGPIYAQEPKSRMRRVISNIEIEEAANGEIVTHSNFVLAELRHGKQDIFAGRAIHRLRRDGDSFRIVSKKVLLVNNDEPIDNLTFLI